MNRHFSTALLTTATALVTAVQTLDAQTSKPAQPLTIQQVRDNLYMISGEGGNVAAYATADGTLLVDDMFYRNYADIVAQVASVTDRKITFVLNTHQHDDHAGGNARMLSIATVVAHDNVRTNLSHIRQPYYEDTPGTPIGLPNVTFADELAVHVGDQDVIIMHLGRGHTNGDAIVYFPAVRAIHTGDLFLARRAGAPPPAGPRGANIYVDYAQGGSFLEWTTTLDRVLALDFDTVIPGHGPVATKEDLVQFRADVAAMRDRIAELIRTGATKEQVLATFEMDYGWRSTGCPPSPPTPGCLQFQQMDALIEELSPARTSESRAPAR